MALVCFLQTPRNAVHPAADVEQPTSICGLQLATCLFDFAAFHPLSLPSSFDANAETVVVCLGDGTTSWH